MRGGEADDLVANYGHLVVDECHHLSASSFELAHIALYGGAPRQTAADGGFASRDNFAQAKALGVHDVAFHKKAGLRILEMVKSNWVYRKLRNFRAGIEPTADRSRLKVL